MGRRPKPRFSKSDIDFERSQCCSRRTARHAWGKKSYNDQGPGVAKLGKRLAIEVVGRHINGIRNSQDQGF